MTFPYRYVPASIPGGGYRLAGKFIHRMNFLIRLAQPSYSRLLPGTVLADISGRTDIVAAAGELSMTLAYSLASGSLSLGQALTRYWNMDHSVSTAATYSSTIPVWYTGINSILSRNISRISASIWAIVLILP